MSENLKGKKILLGVTGSIAAYKAAAWVRNLRQDGAGVTVAMTKAGCRFVSPLTFAALSGNRVFTGMFDASDSEHIPHISLARGHDLILAAPATAGTIARLANGLADDLLATVILATDARVLICPAMNSRMFNHPATQENLARLKGFGYVIVEPSSGSLACGEEGPGRLADWDTVREAMLKALSPQDLCDRSVLITAGPTREPLDPVRHLSNRSTGKMGFALARIARRRGAAVTLVTGPTVLSPPPGVEVVRVNTAAEMRTAVLRRADSVSVIVMAAAVSDYRPMEKALHKIKKTASPAELKLVRNEDILKELGELKKAGNTAFLAGFAAESRDHLAAGRRKLKDKNLDLIVINDIVGDEVGFGAETNQVILVDRDGREESLPLLTKEETAGRIWDGIAQLSS